MTEPPAEILSRLRPIPTYTDHPTTRPHDVAGVDPEGAPCRIEVTEAAAPVVLLFLSAACLGCRDLWEGLARLQAGPGRRGPAGGGHPGPGEGGPGRHRRARR